MDTQAEYIFRRPLWRMVLPFFLLGIAWIVPVAFIYAAAGHSGDIVSALITSVVRRLVEKGVTFPRVFMVAGAVSLPLLLWLYWGFETLVVTPESITRRLPLGLHRTLRWDRMDEVMIEHIENIFEGKRTAKKVMTLFATPRFHLPFRRRMRVTNREFECYHQAERLATQVAIPAITERKRREIVESGRAATFAERMPGGSTRCLVYFLGAALLAGACMPDIAWPPLTAGLKPWAPYVAGFLFLLSARAFFFRQIGVDRDNIYIMRRDWVSRKIPIHSVADVRVLDNRMRILVRDPKSGAERQVFKTSHFIRNRGVLLQLVREMVEAHHETEATPITEMAAR